MDGCAVVRAVRSAPGGEDRVILVYSGYHHREQQALDAGCDAFVLKPAVEELEKLVQGTRVSVRQYVETAGPASKRPR
jgi:CheY-like chemotaxis protein